MRLRTLFLATMAAALAGATPITFTISTTATGTIGSTGFSGATMTFTQTTDTSGIASCGVNTNCSAASTLNTVTISGIGTFTVTDSSLFFDNQTKGAVGFEDPIISDLLDEKDVAVFGAYALGGPLGPDTNAVSLTFSFAGVGTSGGLLSTTSQGPSATFTAVAGVPEPGSLVLLLSGTLALGLVRRFKFSLHD